MWDFDDGRVYFFSSPIDVNSICFIGAKTEQDTTFVNTIPIQDCLLASKGNWGWDDGWKGEMC